MIERTGGSLETLADGRHRRGGRPVLHGNGQCGVKKIGLAELRSHAIRIYILEFIVNTHFPGNCARTRHPTWPDGQITSINRNQGSAYVKPPREKYYTSAFRNFMVGCRPSRLRREGRIAIVTGVEGGE